MGTILRLTELAVAQFTIFSHPSMVSLCGYVIANNTVIIKTPLGPGLRADLFFAITNLPLSSRSYTHIPILSHTGHHPSSLQHFISFGEKMAS